MYSLLNFLSTTVDCWQIAIKLQERTCTDFAVSHIVWELTLMYPWVIHRTMHRAEASKWRLYPDVGCWVDLRARVAWLSRFASISPAGSWKNSQLGEISETPNARIINADLGGKKGPPALFPSRRQSTTNRDLEGQFVLAAVAPDNLWLRCSLLLRVPGVPSRCLLGGFLSRGTCLARERNS